MKTWKNWIVILVLVLVCGTTVIGCTVPFPSELEGKWIPQDGVSALDAGRNTVFDITEWTMYRWTISPFGSWPSSEKIDISAYEGEGRITRTGVTYKAGETHHILYYYETIGDGVMRMRTPDWNWNSWTTYIRVDDWPWDNQPKR